MLYMKEYLPKYVEKAGQICSNPTTTSGCGTHDDDERNTSATLYLL